MAGCDEGYLNITAYMCQHKMTAAAVVKKLRAECVAETGLTVSAGIAPTKMLAKICSDINKPNGEVLSAVVWPTRLSHCSSLPQACTSSSLARRPSSPSPGRSRSASASSIVWAFIESSLI